MQILKQPEEIEKRSFEIVEDLLSEVDLPRLEKSVLERVIHATGDPTYAEILDIHPRAVEAGLEAIRRGCKWFVDVNMVRVGISARLLRMSGGQVVCRVADPEVQAEARRLNLTRCATAMRMAGREMTGQLVVIGNAPTALWEVYSLIKEAQIRPALIIATPVGFVGAAESKEEVRRTGVPYIVTRGTRGGSTVAVAIANALLHLFARGEVL